MSFQRNAFQIGAFQSNPIVDYHDGRDDSKKRDAEFKRKQEELRADLLAAYDRVFGVSMPEDAKAEEIIEAIQAKPDYAEVEKRVVEKLIARHEEIKRQEDEWDIDTILAIAMYE